MYTKKTYTQPNTTLFALHTETHILAESNPPLKSSEKVVTTQEYSEKRNDFDIWDSSR